MYTRSVLFPSLQYNQRLNVRVKSVRMKSIVPLRPCGPSGPGRPLPGSPMAPSGPLGPKIKQKQEEPVRLKEQKIQSDSFWTFDQLNRENSCVRRTFYERGSRDLVQSEGRMEREIERLVNVLRVEHLLLHIERSQLRSSRLIQLGGDHRAQPEDAAGIIHPIWPGNMTRTWISTGKWMVGFYGRTNHKQITNPDLLVWYSY